MKEQEMKDLKESMKRHLGLDANRLSPGESQDQEFVSAVNKRTYIQYDYRDKDGELFSCVRRDIVECIRMRNDWLDRKQLKLMAGGK